MTRTALRTGSPPLAVRAPRSRRPAVVGAAVTVLLVATAGGYGPHRDELYFLRAGAEPAFGYVDQPPLTPLLAHALDVLFDGSLVGLRTFSALAAGVIVVLAGLIAAEFGAGRGAQVLAAASTAVASVVLIVGHTLSTTIGDLLVWALLCWLVVRALRDGGRVWLLVGLVAGVGLENKLQPAFLLAALLAGVLVAGPRAALRSVWPWAGGLVALVLAAPTLIWQAVNGFPLLAVSERIAAGGGGSAQPWWALVPFQLLLVSPVLVPVWAIGWWRLARDPRLRTWRSFAVAYPLLLVVFSATGGKPYYVAGLYPLLLAAGSGPVLAWARMTGARTAALGAALALSLVVSVVLALPVVPVAALAATPVTTLNPDAGETVGWDRFAATIAAVREQIPPGERVAVLTRNYGEAGAVDHYLPGLGPAHSGHDAYWTWGPPPDEVGTVIVIGYPVERVRQWFGRAELATRIDNGVGLDNDEQGQPVVVARDRLVAWPALWPALRRY